MPAHRLAAAVKARLAYHRDRHRNARALRAERRGRPTGDFTDAARKAEGEAQTKGGMFSR
jgi:hypothetical protein